MSSLETRLSLPAVLRHAPVVTIQRDRVESDMTYPRRWLCSRSWRSRLKLVPWILAIYFMIYIIVNVLMEGNGSGASLRQFYKNVMVQRERDPAKKSSLLTIRELRHPHVIYREIKHKLALKKLNATALPSRASQLPTESNTLTTAVNVTETPIPTTPPVNPHDFHYILNNQNICQGINVYVLIFIHSAPANKEARDLIRQTWGSVIQYGGQNIRPIFLLAKPKDMKLQWQIEEESLLQQDIIQEGFLDNYRNLTYKHIMGLKWIHTFCPEVEYVVKVDDDTFVNIFRLVEYLQYAYPRGGMTNMIYCSVFQNQGPRRDITDKWFVPYEEYSHKKYPPYCEGFAYIMSPDLVSKLYLASLQTKFFWIDDVYVTGLLAQKVGARHTQFRDPNGYGLMAPEYTERRKINTVLFILAKYEKNIVIWKSIWEAAKNFSRKRDMVLRPQWVERDLALEEEDENQGKRTHTENGDKVNETKLL